MGSSSFTIKQLRATLTLPGANQTFSNSGNNQLILTGMRMVANLTAAGNWTNFLDLMIYGMKQADMNAVTILWAGPNATEISARALIVLESNDGSGWVQVFEGQFQQASPDYHNVPDVGLWIYAASGYVAQVQKATATSYPNFASVETICETLANQMGFAFENNGVTGQLCTPYFPGTLMDQFRSACRAANIDYYFDANSKLIICPKNSPRQGRTTVLLSKATGLLGYPTIQQYGVNAQCLFTPAIALGGPVQIDTGGEVPGADGVWFPQKAKHQLESQKVGGAWFSSLDCYPTSAVA